MPLILMSIVSMLCFYIYDLRTKKKRDRNHIDKLKINSESKIHQMAIRYSEIGEFEKSNELFIMLDEDNYLSSTHQKISYNYACLKDYDKAKFYIEKAIFNTPYYHRYYTGLAEIYMLQNNFEIAKDVFEISRAKNIKTNNSEVNKLEDCSVRRIDLAIIDYIEDDRAKAISEIEYCKKNSSDPFRTNAITLEEIINKIDFFIQSSVFDENVKAKLVHFKNDVYDVWGAWYEKNSTN